MRPCRWGGRGLEALAVLALVLGACALAAFHLRTLPPLTDGRDGLTPTHFGASVMLACGRGFVNPASSEIPALDDFLNGKSGAFAPSSLPQEVHTIGMDPFVGCHRYLFYVVGLLWRGLGISWEHLKVLNVLFYGVMAVLLYAMFRLGMNPVFSLVMSALFLVTPGPIDVLPYLRDFSKAIFIYGVVFLLGFLMRRPVTGRRLLWMSLLLGTLIGLGLGFRQDMLIALPPALATLLLGVRAEDGWGIRRRILACLLLLLPFYALASPIFAVMRQEGPLSYHHIATGFASVCESGLPLEQASYQRMYAPDDAVVHAAYTSYAYRREGVDHPITPWGFEAATAARGYVLETMRTFPADMLLRGYAATLWALGMTPSDVYRHEVSPYEMSSVPLVRRLAIFELPVEQAVFRWMKFIVPMVLLLISLSNFRMALGVLLFTLYLCGYTSLQFQPRHNFHLGFVPFWFLGFILNAPLQTGLILIRQRGQSIAGRFKGVWLPALGRGLGFGALATLLLLGPLFAARAWQYRSAGAIREHCAQAPCEAMAVKQEPAGEDVLFRVEQDTPETIQMSSAPLPFSLSALGIVLLPPFLSAATGEAFIAACSGEALPALPAPSGPDLRSEYWVAEFASEGRQFDVKLAYDTDNPWDNFSRTLVLHPSQPQKMERLRYFFPVYEYRSGSQYGRNASRAFCWPARMPPCSGECTGSRT